MAAALVKEGGAAARARFEEVGVRDCPFSSCATRDKCFKGLGFVGQSFRTRGCRFKEDDEERWATAQPLSRGCGWMGDLHCGTSIWT